MSKMMRVVVMVSALMSLFAMATASAGAVTWHQTGDTAFTATGGAGTLSGNGLSLTCSSSDATGTSPSGSFAVSTWSGATGSASFTGCKLGGVTTGVSCSYTLTASAFDAGTPARSTGFVDTTCNVTQGVTKVCHVGGSTAGSYLNPTATVNGALTLNASSTLTVSNGTVACPLGNGTTASLTAQTFNITAASGGPSPNRGPIVNRTA